MKTTLLSFAVALVLSINALAQSFTTTYSFDSVMMSSSGLIDPTPVPTVIGVTFGSFSAVGTSANPNAASRFAFTNWPTGATNGNDSYSSLTGSINTSEYYEVTITPATGFMVTLTGITFKIQRSGTGSRTYAVRSSVDGYSSNLSASISPSNTNLSVQSGNIFFWNFDALTAGQNGSVITLASGFSHISSPVKFRFYGWNAEGSSGSFSIDDVSFTGFSSVNSGCTADITTGLVARFDFSGNANDGSTNANNASVSGATLTADRFGNPNSAYSFNGTTDYIDIPHIGAYNNQLYTISFWTKFSAASTPGSGGFNVNPALISKLSPSTSVTYNNWVFYEANGTPGFSYGTAGYGGSNSLFNNNTWHNIICTVNSDSVRFYFDGVLTSVVAKGPDLTFNSQSIRIGRSTATYWKAFAGIIDDIRIYNRALTTCDVDSLFNMPNPSAICSTADITTGLIAQYDFTGNANDLSGNNYNGSVTGATLANDRFGITNSAYSFNGTTDFITLSNTSSLAFQNGITFCAWIKPNAYKNASIVDKMMNSGNGFRISTRENTTTIGITPRKIWAQSSNYNLGNKVNTTSDQLLGNWQFVVGTYGLDDTLRVYSLTPL